MSQKISRYKLEIFFINHNMVDFITTDKQMYMVW